MNIYTSYLPHRAEPVPLQILLEDIIAEIQSGKHQELVQQIHSEPDKAKRNLLKGTLPLFFPTLSELEENRLTDTATPTGIIQFDIDMQDNINTDFDDLKVQVSAIPECIYAFNSPSGGLKFGLLSDFRKRPDDDLHALKERYKQAYGLAKDYISEYVDVNHDDAMSTLKIACYLSWDAYTYFNSGCMVLPVDSQCRFTPPEISTTHSRPVTNEQIQELLSYIPKDSPYSERLHINFAVLGTLGKAAIPLLMGHWSKSDRKKLKHQLESQAKSAQFGNVGHLVNEAKRHGYKPVGSRGRRNLSAKPSEHQYPPQLSVEEASERLRDIVREFFSSGQSTLINVSTGFGKTQAALETLRQIPPNNKVLYLVNNHALAEEIRSKFYNVKTDTSTFKSRTQRKSSVNHIKGKDHLCLMPNVLKQYKNAGVTMPLAQCTQSCPEVDRCPYIEQFQKLGNIRLMTHNEFINEPSAWFHGNKLDEYDNPLPKRSGWKPDYIIVDEDWMKREDHVETITSPYDSIRNIVNNCIDGIKLSDAIQNHHSQVILDCHAMQQAVDRDKRVTYNTREQYIQARKKSGSVYSKILAVLDRYIVSGFDLDVLEPVRFDARRKILISSHMVEIASRYRDVPTLYLDATADERVVKAVHPNINCHSLKVVNADGMNIYQLENYNWTKQRLNKSDSRQKLIDQLMPYTEKYDDVGLITYKNVPTMPDFDKWLGKQLGIKNVAHFGGLRGLDAFADVDCLLIVGRNMIPLSDIEDYSRAVFPECIDFSSDYRDVPVRMKNGKSRSLSNRCYSDSRVEHVKHHFSNAETIQAIGRARLIHGKPKDVYLFSNESLGADVTVTEFFRYEEPKYADAIQELKRIGYCRVKKSELVALGITEHAMKNSPDAIDAEFLAAGIRKVTLKIRDRHYNIRDWEYYVHDRNELDKYLESEKLEVAV